MRRGEPRLEPERDLGAAFGRGAGNHDLEHGLVRAVRRRVQASAVTTAALGEELPFADASFEIVLSDNVIDHAERPLEIVGEICRVLKPGGLLFFTVNIHHPLYNLASRAHGAWNAACLRVELSAFADHTVHLTEKRIAAEFSRQPLKIISQTSTIAETRAAQRSSRAMDPDALLKKLFFKNALFELIAQRQET